MTRDDLPPQILETIARKSNYSADQIAARMRSAEECTAPTALNAMKATRLSFARRLARRMIEQNWSVKLVSFECTAEGRGRGVYDLNLGGRKGTYITCTFPNEGASYGRRTGARRDVYGALFLGLPTAERIEEEFQIMETRDVNIMRARHDVIGWTPGSQSARVFEGVVEALAQGKQPDDELIRLSGYLIRNGGFLTGGRFGTVSYAGIPDDHPLKPAYFADLFGVLLLRQVGFDLANAMAAARSPKAVKIDARVRRYFGVGNASGQGMCVAIQRWTQWFSTWVLLRELALAHASLQPVDDQERIRELQALLARGSDYYRVVQPESEQFIVPYLQIAEGLDTISRWLRDPSHLKPGSDWSSFIPQVKAAFDAETYEQFNALLIEIYPDFADAISDYVDTGMQMQKDFSPELTVGEFRSRYLVHYKWFLAQDLTHSDARRHFWYHSIENGEQRRGERVIDPHEHFESFIDHIGAVQRLAAALASYGNDDPIAFVAADQPDIAFTLSRVQSMAGRPYFEVHGNFIHKDFSPAHVIRFFLSVLGMDSSNPLSIRWVPGVFFQGLPTWDDISSGNTKDWAFSKVLEEAA